MYIFGTLIKIDDYKRLVFEINERTYKNIITYNKDGEKALAWNWKDEKEQERYYCKINLDKYDLKIVEEKFEKFLKKEVIVAAKIQKYEFEDKTGQIIKLQTIKEKKKSVLEIEADLIAESAALGIDSDPLSPTTKAMADDIAKKSEPKV